MVQGRSRGVRSSFIFRMRAISPSPSADGRLFWLGAAFMLLEVHNVSRLALVFGTTWQVNAWVIGVILGLILIANATTLADRVLYLGSSLPGSTCCGLLRCGGVVAAQEPADQSTAGRDCRTSDIRQSVATGKPVNPTTPGVGGSGSRFYSPSEAFFEPPRCRGKRWV